MSSASASKWNIGLALAALYVIWGSTYLAMAIAIRGFPPLLMAAIRFSMAGAIMFLALRLRGVPMPTRRQWISALPIGILLPGLGNGLVAIAQQWVASSLAAVLVASVPLWMALFGSLMGSRFRNREIAGIAIGLVGILILNFEGNLRASPLGAICLLLAPAAWAFGSLWSRRLDLPIGPMNSAIQMLWGGLVLGVASTLRGDSLMQPIPAEALASMGYLVVFGSIVAYSAYGFLLRNVRPALATSYAYVNPLIALGLGLTLGREELGPATFLGTAFVLVAVACVAFPQRASLAKQQAAIQR